MRGVWRDMVGLGKIDLTPLWVSILVCQNFLNIINDSDQGAAFSRLEFSIFSPSRDGKLHIGDTAAIIVNFIYKS